MALTTGNQLKAARALAGIDQIGLANEASVNVNTIRKMEAKGHGPLTNGVLVVRKVQIALEKMGIEFLNHGQPGVRLSQTGAEEKPDEKQTETD